MPTSKSYSEREAFKKEDVEQVPANHTLLSQFADAATTEMVAVIYTGLHQRLLKLKVPSLDVFLSQALLDIILLSKGLVREEPTKAKSDWYLRVERVKGKTQIKYEGVGQTVTPQYKTLRPISRKRIDIPKYRNILDSVPLLKDKLSFTASVPVPVYNEASRLATYWQMSYGDLILQAVETAIWELENKVIAAQGSINAARLMRFTERDEMLENNKLDAVAERLNRKSKEGQA
jgi:hypothetical protein